MRITASKRASVRGFCRFVVGWVRVFLACGSRDRPPDTMHQYLKPLDLPKPILHYNTCIVSAEGHSHLGVNIYL